MVRNAFHADISTDTARTAQQHAHSFEWLGGGNSRDVHSTIDLRNLAVS